MLQQVGVDVRGEPQHLVPQLDRARLERAPRDVHGLVQVVRRRRRRPVRPQQLHRLLTVKAVAGREGEQLDELAGLLQPPRGVRDVHAVDRGREAPQKVHPDSCHLGEIIYDGAAAGAAHYRVAAPPAKATWTGKSSSRSGSGRPWRARSARKASA